MTFFFNHGHATEGDDPVPLVETSRIRVDQEIHHSLGMPRITAPSSATLTIHLFYLIFASLITLVEIHAIIGKTDVQLANAR